MRYDYENKRHQMGAAIALAVGASLILAIVVVVVSFVSTYNDMVDAKEDVNLAEANVETMMQRRLELIPDLVEVVKSYTKHEEKVFEDIANARAALANSLESGDTIEISEANNEFSKQINNLIAYAEAYPDLTAGSQYTSLMDQIERSVNRIAIAREEHNTKVSDYNRLIAKMPACVLADLFGFEPFETFLADKEAEKTNLVDMSLNDD